MSESIVLADDNERLVKYLKAHVPQDLGGQVEFFTSIVECRHWIMKHKPRRVILDQVFDDESATGTEVLVQARELIPGVEPFILTGNTLVKEVRSKLSEINARIVNKANLTWDIVRRLFTLGDAVGSEPNATLVKADVGLLELKLDSARERAKERDNLIDLLAMDLIGEIEAELKRIQNPEVKALFIGNDKYSVDDLMRELKEKSPIGLNLIAIHRWLYNR